MGIGARPTLHARGRSTRIDRLPASPITVVSECLRAHRAQNWERLRELFHPDARIGVFAAGGEPRDPEEAIQAMQAAHEDTAYFANISSIRTLDDHAVLLTGHVLHRSERGRPLKDERVWLYVVMDNQLYRSQVFRTEIEAQEVYRQLGISLGV